MGVGPSIEMRKAMMQREIELSVNIAKARDSLQWFGTLYGGLITGVVVSRVAGRPLPSAVGIPVVMGAFGLSNLYDMAYGTKLTRVVKEAEHIMANERHRFVPPKQAPFNRFYTKAEKAAVADIKAVGEHIPAGLPHSRQK